MFWLAESQMRSRLLLTDDWTFYDKPWGIGLAATYWSFVAEAKLGLPLLSSGVFNEFETRQQKKNWRKLESQAGKVCLQNQKLA